MFKPGLVTALLAACTVAEQPDPQAMVGTPSGPPFLDATESRVIAGYTYMAMLVWSSGGGEDCTTDAFGIPECSHVGGPPAQFQVVGVDCEDCTLVTDPTGRSVTEGVSFQYIPRGNTLIRLSATVSARGNVARADATVPVDHVVAVDGTCWVYRPDFRSEPCGATRRSSDQIFVGVGFRTGIGYHLSPGCARNNTCYYSEEPAPDVFALTPAPARWDRVFAWYGVLGDVSSIAIDGVTPDGEHVLGTIAIPPIVDH